MKIVLALLLLCVFVNGNENPNFRQINIKVHWTDADVVESIELPLNNVMQELKLHRNKLKYSAITLKHSNSLITEDYLAQSYQYQGTITGNKKSKAALSVNNLNHTNGFVFDGKDLFTMTYFDSKQFILRVPQVASNPSLGKNIFDWGRSTGLATPVHMTMAIVIDHTFFKQLDASTENAIGLCFSIINQINSITSQLNFVIDVGTIDIWTDKDYIDMNYDKKGRGADILQRFNVYFNKQMSGRDSVDFGVFFTQIELEIDGKTYNRTMGFRNGSSILVLADNFSLTKVSLTTIHEVLHLVGVEHDKYTNDFLMAKKATNERCIMVSKESVIQLNARMPEVLGRLRQKDQQWTPIVTTDSGAQSSDEPVNLQIIIINIFCILAVVIIVLVFIYQLLKPLCVKRCRYSFSNQLELQTENYISIDPDAITIPIETNNTESIIRRSLSTSNVSEHYETVKKLIRKYT